MVAKRRPDGEELEQFCRVWDASDKDGKLLLVERHGVSYDTGKHWRSESGVPKTVDTVRSVAWAEGTHSYSLSLPEGKVVVINDLHMPYHDKETLRLLMYFLAEIQPDIIIIAGDIYDFHTLSSFSKDPRRLADIQEDTDMVNYFLDRLKADCPNSEIIWLDGNHELRLQTYLWSKAQALSSLHCLTIDALFELTARGIKYVPYELGVLINEVFLVLHGDLVRQHSGYTAKALMEKHGGNGIAGHTHRLGQFIKRDRFGTYGWWENGCLCDLNPEWVQNPNWAQGFSIVHFKSDRFWVEQIPIINHKFMYGGKLYA